LRMGVRLGILGITISGWPSVAGTFAAVFGVVYGACFTFDGIQSAKTRKRWSAQLLNVQISPAEWHKRFEKGLFEFFGDKCFSLKRLARISLCAILLALTMFAVATTFLWNRPDFTYMGSFFGFFSHEFFYQFPFYCVAVLPAALFGLGKLRLLSRSFNITDTKVLIATALFDAVAAAIIPAMWFYLAIAGHYRYAVSWELIRVYIDLFLLYLFFALSSVFVWSCLFVQITAVTINQTSIALKSLSEFIDVEGHPVRSAGYVLAVVIAVIVTAITVV